jgi:hypothetical protein
MLKLTDLSFLTRPLRVTFCPAFRRSGWSEFTEDFDLIDAASLEDKREKKEALFIAGMVSI